MKKSLLALAVLGAFAGAASAQSSVVIYGSVDQGVVKGNGGSAVNPGGLGPSEAWNVRESHGSRLGFRGNEDLGGGLSAQFLIEHRLSPDTGAANGAVFWQGASYVQLTSAAAGSVYLGRWYTPMFWVGLKTDPFGYDSVATASTRVFAGYGSPVRFGNSVGYKTPNWGGFTANVAVSAGEGATNRQQGLNAEYTAGPIYAAAAYEGTTGSGATDGNKVYALAFGYNFGVVNPNIYFSSSKTGAGNTNTNKFVRVALTAPAGPGVIKAAYYRYTPESDIKESKIGLGYDYFLSKRTRIYADIGAARQDGQSNNTAYNVGVRHDF
ncbi:MAG: porin [Rhizobacter sp.]|nr:porin [Rhizobacter sp.]